MTSISIIGAGNVGGSFGRALLSKGYDVLFYDVSWEQLSKLKDYKHTNNLNEVLKSDLVIITVPTESLLDGGCDLRILKEVVNDLKVRNYGGLVVQTSTCPPGTAREMSFLLPNYVVVPSHGTMESMDHDLLNPLRMMIGTATGEPNQVMAGIAAKFGCPIYFDTYEEVELVKYCENVLSATIISYWNEMFLLCEKLKNKGVNVDSDRLARIIDGSSAFHSIYRFHGKAYGGACIPKDTKAYIKWCDSVLNYTPKFAMASNIINGVMKEKYGVETRHLIYRN